MEFCGYLFTLNCHSASKLPFSPISKLVVDCDTFLYNVQVSDYGPRHVFNTELCFFFLPFTNLLNTLLMRNLINISVP